MFLQYKSICKAYNNASMENKVSLISNKNVLT